MAHGPRKLSLKPQAGRVGMPDQEKTQTADYLRELARNPKF